MWPVFRERGFSLGRGISVGDVAGGSAAGAKGFGVESARTRAVLGWVRHVVSRVGDVAFLGFTFGRSIGLHCPSVWFFNVDIIRLRVSGCLPAPRLKVGNVDIT